MNLRPLSLGEVLDRAFSIYFKHIAAFSALVGIVLIPYTIVAYLQSRDVLAFFITTIQHQIQSPTSTPDVSKLSALQPSSGLIALQYAILFLGFPFAYGAVIAGVSRAYLGLPVLFADAYRFALRRWLPILILIILWFFAGAAIVLVLAGVILIGGIFIGALVSIGGNSAFFSIGAGIIAIVSVFVLVGMVIMLYLTFAMSFISVVIENIDPIKAFTSAFARMFSGGQFWRGFVLALALMGISLGAQIVTGGGGMLLAYFLRSPALYLIAIGMTSLFFVPFALVTAAVFYYDVRIRREGYDLQMLVDRFSSAAPPAGG